MKKRAFLYIIIAGILWGTSGLFVNFLAPFGFTSLQMVAVRGIVSAICIAVYVFFHNNQLFCITKKELFLFVCSGLGLFGTASFYYTSIQASSVSTAVVLMYTAPVIVMAYSVAFLGEKFTRLKGISVACMLIGCGLVSGLIGGLKFSVWGVVSGLLSGISYSAYNIFTKIQMRKKSNPLSASMYCFIFMSLIALCASNPQEIPALVSQNPFEILPVLLGLGVGTALFPYVLYTLALKELPVGTASALGIIEPMSATVFSVVLLGEPLDLPSLLGIILILGAVLLLSKSEDTDVKKV